MQLNYPIVTLRDFFVTGVHFVVPDINQSTKSNSWKILAIPHPTANKKCTSMVRNIQ